MQIRKIKHPFMLVTAVIITILITWGLWPKPVIVEIVTAVRAPLRVSIEEEGRTRVTERYVIAAPVDGVTCRIQLHVGDTVAQEQILLRITPLAPQVLDPRTQAQAVSKVEAAKSAVRAAKEHAQAAEAAKQLAASELKRLKPLLDKGVIAQNLYERTATEASTAAAARRSASFNVEVAEYELQAAQSVLEYTADNRGELAEGIPIRSPISGKILKVEHQCEGPVRTGQPLFEVGDPSSLEIEVDVLSADAVKLKPAMKVQFNRWGGEQELEGVVRVVEPVGFTKVSALGVEEQRVLVISDFTSAAELWQRLGDGYRVEAQFVLWEEDNVLQVPSSSLFRYQGGWALFVVENQYARLQEVKIGKRNDLVVQLLDGINEGDTIINHPNDEVDDGKSVKPR